MKEGRDEELTIERMDTLTVPTTLKDSLKVKI